MLKRSDIDRALATMPPVPLDSAAIRAAIAARSEPTLEARIATAAYLDGISAQEVAQMPSSVRAGRLVAFADEKAAILAEREASMVEFGFADL